MVFAGGTNIRGQTSGGRGGKCLAATVAAAADDDDDDGCLRLAGCCCCCCCEELKAQWRGHAGRRWIDDGPGECARPRQAERQLTGHIRTRLLYVAITADTGRRAALLLSRRVPLADFVKCPFSPTETSNSN